MASCWVSEYYVHVGVSASKHQREVGRGLPRFGKGLVFNRTKKVVNPSGGSFDPATPSHWVHATPNLAERRRPVGRSLCSCRFLVGRQIWRAPPNSALPL